MRNTTIMATWLFLSTLAGYAQTIDGSISGRVIDPQGAAITNAAVTVAEPAKNVKIAVKTTGTGDFTVAGLQPGSYSITVESAGFKKLVRTAIPLDANQKLAVGDMTLEVGAVTESVEVTAQAALLQTESVERSNTITGKQVENIEVNGRNPLDMAKLVPGVQFTTGTSYAIGSSSNGANDFTVNGARPSQNQLSINGIGNVDTGNNGGMNVAVSIDSIAEFSILTGSYQAEYGRSVGGQINMITKSGSDTFHGSGYWYHRNDGLNANTFLNNARGLASPSSDTTIPATPLAVLYTSRTCWSATATRYSSSSARSGKDSCLPIRRITSSFPRRWNARAISARASITTARS